MDTLKTLIIFDIDGTLVYSESRDSQCFGQAYRETFGKPFPTLDWTNFSSVTDTSIFGEAYRSQFQKEVDSELFDQFFERYLELLKQKRELNADHSLPIPGVRELIEVIKESQHMEYAIATGGWERAAKLKLEHIGLEIDQIPLVGADGRETREEILTLAKLQSIQNWGTFDQIVYVGDAIWDVQTTRNLKMNFVGVRWRSDFEVLTESGAHTVVSNYLNQEEFFLAIQNACAPISSSEKREKVKEKLKEDLGNWNS